MSHFTLPFDIESLEITAQSVDLQGNIILDVVSKKTSSTCHKCGKPATKRHGVAPFLKVQHLSILDTPVYIRIRPVRYQCEHCDDHPTTTEQYDWCDRGSKITKGLSKYLLRNLIHSTVSDVARKEGIGYKTVVSLVNRQVSEQVNWDNYSDFDTIGIDEIALKKGHNHYVTIVSVNSQLGPLSVVGVLPGRSKEGVKDFLKSIPPRLQKTVNSVCTDMYEGFVQAASEVFGARVIVIDRYHVAQLYRQSLDKVRLNEMARLRDELSPKEYRKLDGVMWILRKKYECLTKEHKETLATLYKYSPLLKKAHRYALKLTHIFNAHSSRKLALAQLDRWIKSVEKSGIPLFTSFIKTLKKFKSGIANYFKKRKNSGFVEGLNNKIKVAKRRCYGFFKTTSLFQRLQLDLNGYKKYAR